MPFKAEPLIAVGRVNLELSVDSEQGCPVYVPIEMHVIANLRCCDLIPSQGECISPFIRVRKEPDPLQWYKLGPYVEDPLDKEPWWRKLW